MDEDIKALLDEAVAAMRGGADVGAIDKRIKKLTGGKYDNMLGLSAAVQQMEREAPERQAQDRMVERGGSALGDFWRMAAQGASFGFADELAGVGAAMVPGGRGYTEARDASRQRVSDLRTLAPGASMAAEAAGGVAVPFFTGSRVAGAIARPSSSIPRLALAGAAGGAAGGGVSGALFGFGDTDGSLLERATQARRQGAFGAAAGAALGGVLPVAGAGMGGVARYAGEVATPNFAGQQNAARRLAKVFDEAGVDIGSVGHRLDDLGPDAVIADIDPRLGREARNAVNQAPSLTRTGGPVSNLNSRIDERGERMARQLREMSGITETMAAGEEAARAAVQRVSREHYQPLERMFPEVTGDNVLRALQDPTIRDVARRTLQREGRQPGAPSFKELQDIMMDLRDEASAAKLSGRQNASDVATGAYENLVSAMERDIPGFAEAQRTYALASRRLEGYQLGYDMWTKPSREIREALDALPAGAQDSFRVGMLQRWEEQLLDRTGTSGSVNSILRAGEEMKETIKALFDTNADFVEFLRSRDIEDTFRRTEVAVTGNSKTAEQSADIIDSVPESKSQLVRQVINALFSPAESRRVQNEIVGNTLLGNDARGLEDLMRESWFRRPIPRVPQFARPNVPGGFAGVFGGGLGMESNR